MPTAASALIRNVTRVRCVCPYHGRPIASPRRAARIKTLAQSERVRSSTRRSSSRLINLPAERFPRNAILIRSRRAVIILRRAGVLVSRDARVSAKRIKILSGIVRSLRPEKGARRDDVCIPVCAGFRCVLTREIVPAPIASHRKIRHRVSP